mmetsp:Transcript_6709/g.16657  ORF Transcript_6709/g.16657 Transcript_6709/m.16657 type:complete len:257 (+) Transcript_6709:2471-3241(+)
MRHAELGQVGFEGDARPVVGLLTLGHHGHAREPHVVLEHLPIAQLAAAVARLEDKLGAEDVGQLGAVAVAPARHLFLVIVVVGGGEQVAEDELGDVHPLLLVHLHRDAVAVVVDADDARLGVDVDPERAHGRVAHLVIVGVDQDLVEDFVQAGHERHLALHQLVQLLVVHPRQGLSLLARSHVRVWAQEDVLQLRFLLVDLFHGPPAASRGGRDVGGLVLAQRRLGCRLLGGGGLLPRRRGGILGELDDVHHGTRW